MEVKVLAEHRCETMKQKFNGEKVRVELVKVSKNGDEYGSYWELTMDEDEVIGLKKCLFCNERLIIKGD